MTDHLDEGPDWYGRVRVLMPDEYNKHAWSFFTKYKGDSWHGGDAQFIFWMGSHWILITAFGFGLAALIGSSVWYLCLGGRHGRYGLVGHASPQLMARRGRRLPFWRRWAGKQAYELVEQHNA